MKTQVTHNLMRHGYRSLEKALDACENHQAVIRLRTDKNIISRSFDVHCQSGKGLTIVGNGPRKTVIYLSNSILMFKLLSGNLKLKNLTIILSAYSRLFDASSDYQGHLEFDHVRVYHEYGLKRKESTPDVDLISPNGVLNVKLTCFDCQFDCLYAGIKSFEFVHCLIGNLWSRSSLIGAYRGHIVKSVLANTRFEAVNQGQINLEHDTVHGLLSFGGHIRLRHLLMQAPKAPTGWVVRHRLHKLNRVYRLPKAVDFIMADNSCYTLSGVKLTTFIDCHGLQEDGNSFKIWQKNAHLRLNPRWFALKNVVALIGDYELPSRLDNQFINCKLNGKPMHKKNHIKPLIMNKEFSNQAKKAKPYNKTWVHKLSIKQMLAILIRLMKSQKVVSDGPSTSKELIVGLKLIHQRHPTRRYVIGFYQQCLHYVRKRIKTESADAQKRDGRTMTYDDVVHAANDMR